VEDVKGSTGSVASSLSKLAARPPGLGNRGLSGVNGAFSRYLDYGSNQLPWLHSALGSATTLADVAEEIDDPDMELALLRMAGPRLEAAMFGAMLLAAWLDWLQLADVVLRECPAYSVEKLFMDMHRVQGLIEPTLVGLVMGSGGVLMGSQVVVTAEWVWPKEWNRMIMTELLDAETQAGRMLRRSEIMRLVAKRMKFYDIPSSWTANAPETHEERVRQAGDSLLANPPPAGWRPLGPDDELLRTLLPDEEA
jgi:hypothetical protein